MNSDVQELKTSQIYPWLVAIGVFFVRFGGIGCIIAESAIYFVPIREELGIMPGELSWWITAYAFGMAFSMLYVGRLYPKIDTRILLTGAYLIAIGATAAMGFYTEVWQFCVSGVIIGLSGGFLFMVPGPIILSNWFEKRRGLAIGFSALGSGVAGMVLPLIGVVFIEAWGWRVTEFIMAGIGCVLVLPWTLFVIRYDPKEKGMRPYGWESDSERKKGVNEPANNSGVLAKDAILTVSFVALFLGAGIASCFGGFRQHFTTMADQWGHTAMFAALMLSVSSFASFLQPIVGWFNDKFSSKSVTLCLASLVLISLLGFLFFHDSEIAVLFFSFLFMLQVPIVGVQIPLITREVFGAKEYAKIFSYIQMGIGLIGAFAAPMVGYFYGAYGNYDGAFVMGICFAVFVILTTIVAFAFKRRLKWND